MISIIEKMTGQFSDGKACPVRPDADSIRQSVCDNLYRIYSSKRGMQEFVPLFGLTDTAAFYRCALQSSEDLRKQLQENAELFEPRLQHQRVTTLSFDVSRSRLIYKLAGSLSGQRVNFEISFGPDGRCWVK